jgi:predicted  nucleic acid-binding Zn-ribbon protein
MGFCGDAVKVAKNQLEQLLEIAKLANDTSRIAEAAKKLLSGEALSQLSEELLACSERVSAAMSKTEELGREIARHEGDLVTVLRRIEVDEKRLNETSSPKDAVGISHELETLAKRQRELEDQQLEVMNDLEGAETELAEAKSVRDQTEQQLASLRSNRADEVARLKSEHSALIDKVKVLRSGLPIELLEIFDARAKRGVPIGRLVKATCGACHMGLTSTAVGVLNQPGDELKFCPECAAILVVA